MNKKMLFILLLGISLAFFLLLTNHNYFVGAQSLLQTDQTATPLPDDMGDGDDIGQPLSVTVTPLPDVFQYGQDKKAKFSFNDLDYSEIVLTFPDVETVDINLPDQWNLDAPSYIELHYDLLDDRLSPDLTSTEENEATNLQDVYSAPYVLVYVDNYLAGGFRPEFGENHTVKINMPIAQMEQALTFDTENYHEVRIEFFEGAEDYYCEYDGVLTIQDDSSFNFSIHTVPTYLDLGDFPAPIVHSSFIPETLYVILPNNYSEKDLDALATVGSAIGRENASVNIEVITASQATQEKLGDHHIIVIGEPSQNEFLMRLYNQDLFDTTLSANKLYYRNRELPEEEGVLQLIRSPYDDLYAALIVTGNSGDAVVRAANALAQPPLLGLSGNIAIIPEEAQAKGSQDEIEEGYYFSDLGGFNILRYGGGTQYAYLSFLIPRDWEIKDDASVVFRYANSTNLSAIRSNINVELNGVAVGNIPPSEVAGEKQFTLPLQKENILAGTLNTFRFEFVLSPEMDDECALFDPRAYWVSVRDNSFLVLPHEKKGNDDEFGAFYHPLLYLAGEENVLFVLPSEPTQNDLNALIGLVLRLSEVPRIDGGLTNFFVSFDPDVAVENYEDYSFVFIGKPTTNPNISKINDSLPQGFVPGEDILANEAGETYRVSPGFSIGIVEAVSAPWHQTGGVTLISGTTDQGLMWVFDKIALSRGIYEFNDDLSFVQGADVLSFQTKNLIANDLSLVVDAQIEIQNEEEVEDEISVTTSPTQAPIKPTERVFSEQQHRQFDAARPLLSSTIGTYVFYGLIGLAVLLGIFGISRTLRGGRKR